MLKSWFTATFLTALGLSTYQYVAADQWDGRADEIVDSFSTEDLIGQMAQIDISVLMTDDLELDEDTVRKYAKMRVGSYLNSPLTSGPKNGTYLWTAEKWREVVTRIQEITMEENGGHPMIYGVDSINDAASFRPDLVYEQGRITARDTLAAGIPWIFGPILDISRNPLWPRTFETFGEDPYLDSVMADAIVRGLQSNGSTAACMKHWIVYTKTPTGHDKDAVTVSDYDLLNYFLPPFKAAVGAGVLSAMENYISVNGVPLVSNTKLMNALLRDDLGWDGMMVTDYAEIDQLADFHRVARTYDEATRISLTRVSVDMSMIATDDSFMNGTKALLEQSPQYLARVKASARRVVKLKLQLGLYDNPVPGEANVDLIGSENDTATALELARESIVLLKNNDSVLPLAEDASVFLTGHAADDIGLQCGGWTIEWQGYAGHNELYPLGSTMKENIESITGNSSSVSYFNGLNYTGEYSDADLATATEYASRAEFTVAAIGEGPYAEKPGDINDLALPAGQIEYVKQLASTGTKVIVVLFEGRPRLLGDLTDSVYAVIDGLLACEMGGQAVAEILYGKVNPSGLTTLCEDSTETPYYCENEWDFGTGLSYTDFTYSAVTLSKDTIQDPNDSIAVSVDVTNSGSMAGKETVMLFLIQPYRSLNVPEMKQLKKFSKISLEVGETQTVQFTLTAEDWSVYYPQIGRGLKLVAEDSEFWVAIKPETDCDVYNETAIRSSLCSNFTLSTGEYPFGTIEIPW
ncbi:Lysosomal beta glucosidase [Phytophthora cactorum]|uniref:beta-glucosidase n=1 Tax=Phytophthora cactorum TaxID=29920 RepID=A0A329S6D2_9STRA|nr:Lysosomal beta glucosidase [Phytophthora cactorum]